MSHLSHWWYTEYADDIEETLRERENQLITYYFQSPQIEYRHYLIELICTIAESRSLSRKTVHLSVYILDSFMDNHNIYPERLKLVALVCLLVASKFEERECKVPKIADLNTVIKNQYPHNDFYSLELMVLTFMNWNLTVPTTATFIERYVGYVVHCSEVDEGPGNPDSDLIFKATTLVFEFLNMVLAGIFYIYFFLSLYFILN